MSKTQQNIKLVNADDPVLKRFEGISPSKKLELSLQLYYSARELKKAMLKSKYPNRTEAELEKELREIFLYART